MAFKIVSHEVFFCHVFLCSYSTNNSVENGIFHPAERKKQKNVLKNAINGN